MKPDKHKKKRSEQYIKKHNGVDGVSGSIKEIHEQRKLDQSSVIYGKGQRFESTTTDSRHLARNGLQKLENSSDAGTDTTKYGRRKLESNWNKYEIIDSTANGEEEEGTMRGADFSELVLLNKHVLPEYQFDSFSDTTRDAAATEGKDDFTKHVFLDCDLLSFALRCVPLCKRLDIDESFFDEFELAAFEKDAADRLKGYQAFLDSRKAAQCKVSRNDTDSEQIGVPETKVVTLRDLDIDSTIMSCDTTETAVNERTDDAKSPELPSTAVKSVYVQNKSSQNQIEAFAQVSAASVLSPQSTEDSSDCKLLGSSAQLGESDANRSTDVAISKPEEVSAATETCEKSTAGCFSVKEKSTDSVSLAELEDELDSLLAF